MTRRTRGARTTAVPAGIAQTRVQPHTGRSPAIEKNRPARTAMKPAADQIDVVSTAY